MESFHSKLYFYICLQNSSSMSKGQSCNTLININWKEYSATWKCPSLWGFFWTYAMKLEAAIQKWLFLCKKVLPKRSYIFPSPTPKCLEETWSPFHAIPAGFTEELTQRDQRKHQREIAHSLSEATVMDAQPGPGCQTPSGVCPVFEVGIKHPDGARHCQWGRKETPFHSLH